MRVITLNKEKSKRLIRRAHKAAKFAVRAGLRDPEAYDEARRLIERHRDLTLDKLVVVD